MYWGLVHVEKRLYKTVMYSKMWIAEGMTYSGLITELTELAFARQKENERDI